MKWQPSLGAWPEGEGTHFRVWAPDANGLQVLLEKAVEGRREFPLQKPEDGFFSGVVAGIGAGDLYCYRIDGRDSYPDPASRFQPDGVHGSSQVIDPCAFSWSDSSWRGLQLEQAIFYELHVGTFTPDGTFRSALQRLPELKSLGVTAIELMPVADFGGSRNWGYDGVALFAPARCYGRPDDLRRFVDLAHQLGLAVFLDVVYNHLGPDGNYLGIFSPHYFSDRHQTAWGPAVNFDGKQSGPVRDFFIENALHWLHEYHFDGLRLDATHAMLDDSPRHFLAELSARVRQSFAESSRRVLLIAEDSRNLTHMMMPEEQGGWGMDGVWADDFHHQVRRLLAGDHDGYFQDYSGSVEDLATTVRKGWFFCGQHSRYLNRSRGTEPSGIAPERFVICLQNHDQIGNRAFGDRLHHKVDLGAYRAATAFFLCCPQTPLLFMGQEWAASSPFQFFTDHHQELGKLVTAGRRHEFRHFQAFRDPQVRETIPDPQAVDTFVASRLNWSEREAEPHASTLRFYQALLSLRREEPALRSGGKTEVVALHSSALALRRSRAGAAAQGRGRDLLVVVQMAGRGSIDLEGETVAMPGDGLGWQLALSSEAPEYAPDAQAISIRYEKSAPSIAFTRPGAVILKEEPTETIRR